MPYEIFYVENECCDVEMERKVAILLDNSRDSVAVAFEHLLMNLTRFANISWKIGCESNEIHYKCLANANELVLLIFRVKVMNKFFGYIYCKLSCDGVIFVCFIFFLSKSKIKPLPLKHMSK